MTEAVVEARAEEGRPRAGREIDCRPMNPELRAAFEETWKENEAGFRYLADHD